MGRMEEIEKYLKQQDNPQPVLVGGRPEERKK
jgi:hypothetical protein